MTEKTITYTIADRLSRNIREEDFKMFDEEGNTNFYIIRCMDTTGEFSNYYDVYMGGKLFNGYKTITGAKIGITKTFAQDENGNGLIPRDEINVIIVETVEKIETEGSEKMEKYLGVKTLKNGTEEEVIIEAEDWDEALLIMGSICAFDDNVDDYTCDLATDEDVARVQANELSEEERKFLELRLEHLLMMLYGWKRAYFGVTPKPSKNPYEDEISEIKRKLGKL